MTATIAAARWYALATESLPAGSPELAEALAHQAHALFVGGRQSRAAEVGRHSTTPPPATACSP